MFRFKWSLRVRCDLVVDVVEHRRIGGAAKVITVLKRKGLGLGAEGGMGCSVAVGVGSW